MYILKFQFKLDVVVVVRELLEVSQEIDCCWTQLIPFIYGRFLKYFNKRVSILDVSLFNCSRITFEIQMKNTSA